MPVPLYKPQLAQLVKEPPVGDEWLHEMKYDGYRIGCRIVHGRVNLISRNGKDWTNEFPEVCEAARGLGVRDALLDGEVAIVLPDGRTSFQDLQNAFTGGSRRGLVYFAFDLIHAGGETFVKRPLIERKKELLRLVGKPRARSRIRYSEHVVGQGATVFAEACRLHLEGIVSKLADSEYRAGRHGGWVKTKCILRQEFVIGGFTDPEGSRQGIGALLVGYFDEGRLVFAGKVGTGFTVAVARDLRKRLEAIEQPHAAFDPRPAGWLGNHAHWVRPTLVAEVTFTEWTGDGNPSSVLSRTPPRQSGERSAPRKRRGVTCRRDSKSGEGGCVKTSSNHADRARTRDDCRRQHQPPRSDHVPGCPAHEGGRRAVL